MQFCVAHAHRVLLVFILSLAGVSPLAAQVQTLDIASFTPPSGWNSAQQGDHLVLTFIDQTAKTYVMLAVYPSRARSGDAEKDFAAEWKDVVVRSFSEAPVPHTASKRTKSGLEFREGSANVSASSGKLYVRLMVFPAERRMLSVMAVATHEGALAKQQNAVSAFVDSLKLSAQPAVAGKPPAASGSSSSSSAGSIASAGAPRSSSGIAGVWLGFKAYYPSFEPRPRWYVYFEDGTVFEDIPRQGLAGFNRQASKADSHQKDYWGSYSMSGSAGTITKPGVKYPEKIELEAAGKMKLDGLVFQRCRPVDGLRLQGAWTSYSNPNDPALDRLPRGQAPIFHFTSDGKFVDDGVLAAFLWEGDRSTDYAGAGTYEIRDFTLVLRYSDGRVKPFAFSGLCPGDPFTSNDLVFIGRSEFRKRK